MSHHNSQIKFTTTVPLTLDHTRLDLALSTLLPAYSRARIQAWIKQGYVTVNNKTLRPKDKVFANQVINLAATITDATWLQPQPLQLNIVYEDQDIIILNKPAGLVIHPGAGNRDNTLLNALLYHYPELAALPRAGIIHRLDKDTSGIMVVTRNLMAHNKLTRALQNREIKREYIAIVTGHMIAGGTIEAPIGRHPTKRTLMAIKCDGKPAITHYRVIQRFAAHTYLRVFLETGRTHQIRVHLAHIGYPIVGDPTYSKISKVSTNLEPTLRSKLETFKRQALHARRLELTHPRTNKLMAWEVAPPQDIEELLEALIQYSLNKQSI